MPVSGNERSGGQLLLKGTTIWGTNVIAYGLWFWALDRGGPVRRGQPDPPPADFQFPQMENPGLAEPGWYPRLFDYIYISFTNSIAFSPTDAMPTAPPPAATRNPAPRSTASAGRATLSG